MEIIDMITKRKLKKMMSVLFISGCFFIGNTKCKGADLEYISQETANYVQILLERYAYSEISGTSILI